MQMNRMMNPMMMNNLFQEPKPKKKKKAEEKQ
jgi:hypothetical protein